MILLSLCKSTKIVGALQFIYSNFIVFVGWMDETINDGMMSESREMTKIPAFSQMSQWLYSTGT